MSAGVVHRHDVVMRHVPRERRGDEPPPRQLGRNEVLPRLLRQVVASTCCHVFLPPNAKDQLPGGCVGIEPRNVVMPAWSTACVRSAMSPLESTPHPFVFPPSAEP